METTAKAFFRYLTVSRREEDWGLHLTALGRTSIRDHSPYPALRHPSSHHFTWEKGRILDEYQFIYITHGSGLFESEPTGRRTIQAGNLFVLFPGVWHRYRPSRLTGWDENWFAVRGEQMERLQQKDFFNPARAVLNPGVNDMIYEQFTRLIEEAQGEAIGYQQVLAARAMQIMAMVQAIERGNQAGGDIADSQIQRAKVHLAGHLHEEVDLEALARELHLSYVHFRRLFKHYTGLAPHQYQLQLRINRAKELLKTTELPIKEIAAQLGFENQYYFSKIFRRKVGLSPQRWRE